MPRQMPPRAPPYFPSEERSQQEEREHAVDHFLEDMRRFIPTATEPMTLSAIRDYMVTRYDQIENYDKLVIRHEATKILIRDAERQLKDLTEHAQALSAASRNGGAAEEAVLRQFGFSQENFQEALSLAVALRARLVVCNSEYTVLHTRTELLEQEVQQYKAILQRQAEERERAKHILERVETERDRSSRTIDYVIHQANDLERRLQETERRYQEAKRSLDLRTHAHSHQGHTSAQGATPEPARCDTRPKRTSAERWMDLQRRLEPGQYRPVLPKLSVPESFGQLAIKESEEAGKTTQQQALIKDGDTSAEKPVSPQKIIPCVPLVAPKPVMQASFLKEQEGDTTNVPEEGQPSLQAAVSSLLICFPNVITDNGKQMQEDGSSKADRGPQVQPWQPDCPLMYTTFKIGSFSPSEPATPRKNPWDGSGAKKF